MKKILTVTVLAMALLALAAYFIFRPAPALKEFILQAQILTMDPKLPRATAVWVRDGSIVQVGTLEDFEPRDTDIPVIDLQDQTLTPGLIEPHTHPVAAALLGAAVDVSAFTHDSRAAIIKTLEEATSGLALTPWLVAFGWDPVAISDLTPPTLAELDALFGDRPALILTQMMHEAYMNSAGYEAAGIKLRDPSDQAEGIMRDDSGHVTGTLREVEAINRVVAAIPSAPAAATELLLSLQLQKYARAGYTTIGVTGAVGRHSDPVGLLKKLSITKSAPVRTFVYLLPDQMGAHPLGGDTDFAVIGVKLWLDGSPFTGGAAFAEPYEDSGLVRQRLGIPHTHHAELNYTFEELKSLMTSFHEQGYQIALHVQGERAVDDALAIFESLTTGSKTGKLQHRLEHHALITRSQLEQAQKLGLSTGFFVDHVYYYGDALKDLIGEDRSRRYMPVKSALDAGLVTSLHGDHPATPVDALRVLNTAATRLSRSGQSSIAPDQAISREDALFAMTMGAARQLKMDHRIGSITAGKAADFTLFNHSPLDPPGLQTSDAAQLRVLQTWKEGRVVTTSPVTLQHASLAGKTLLEIMGF
ncbi:amidohydrolase [Sneathiella glossodoripedis]|uniref:amidohydrolase n=1 Tax=Sneathiella glossodoripedis TaxID=418853 RepID=UPI00046FA089|nr:amidohydrolase [Sneathiella glossodoripedis]